MNILAVEDDPRKAAIELGDSHIIKVISESCQLLTNLFDYTDLFMDAPRSSIGKVRQHHNTNHPCTLWIKKSTHNAQWLIDNCDEMLQEYHRRFDRPNTFTAARSFLNWVKLRIQGDSTECDPFVVAIPKSATCRQHEQFEYVSEVWQYRLYYACDKIFARWERNRPEPGWHEELMKNPHIKRLRRERMKQI